MYFVAAKQVALRLRVARPYWLIQCTNPVAGSKVTIGTGVGALMSRTASNKLP